jgi:hypothetical protein
MTAYFETPFAELLREPTFVLTGDQDWAPDWALGAMLEIVAAHDVPLHLFVTNDCETLHGTLPAGMTLGIHPNFRDASSHGASPHEIIDFCQSLVPDAVTFRTHAITEDNYILCELARRGFVADSNLVTFLQPGLVPIIHSTGLLRFPIFLEDDIFMWWASPELHPGTLSTLFLTPGLKVLNFHPALVGINAPSVAYYDARRPELFGAPEPRRRIDPYTGRGVSTLLIDLITAARRAGHTFTPFPELVTRAQACLERTFPDGLYRWPHDAATGPSKI